MRILRTRWFLAAAAALVLTAGIGVGIQLHRSSGRGDASATTPVPTRPNRPRATRSLARASCLPSPCSAGATPSAGDLSLQPSCRPGVLGGGSHNLVSVGAISDGSTSSCRVYGYYVPKNLVGRAPAIFVAAGTNGLCGTADPAQVYRSNHWHTIADENALVVVYLAKVYNGSSCTSGSEPTGWRHPNVDAPDPGAGAPSDEPYVTAVVDDATRRLNLDAQRLYLTGASAGGSLTLDVACDATNRAKFRGFETVSADLQTTKSGSSPVTGTERCGPPGNGAGANYDGGATSPMGRRFFYIQLQGVLDGSVPFTGACGATHCTDSFEQETIFWRTYMGCAATPSSRLIGSPKAENTLDDYSACTFGINAAFETEKVLHGCHSWQGLDAVVDSGGTTSCAAGGTTNPTNGFDSARLAWQFFSTRKW
jgi:poly(3-hydroxybutyrate) depolymerase